ncbi:MAG: hypothetical protein HOB51_06960 [Thaumarchaeota archaeon]|nr:hypothetical protein [Nitrososphaerota archaeon]
MSKKNNIGVKCPVCEEEFSTESAFNNHIQTHVAKSVLSEPVYTTEELNSESEIPIPKINLDKIFDKEKIEELIKIKIKKIDNTDDLINSRIFIEQFKKINQKSPLLYLPYFIEDFMNGVMPYKIQKKYHISSYADYTNITKIILQFRGTQMRVRENNLRHDNNWKEKYDLIKKYCNLFRDEITLTILFNMLQTQILLLLMDGPLEKDQIIDECKNIENIFDIFRFTDNELEQNFLTFINDELNDHISEIIYLLMDEEIITRNKIHPKELEVKFDVDELRKNILIELSLNENKQNTVNLRNSILNEFFILRLLPGFSFFKNTLADLEHEKIIHLEPLPGRWGEYEVFLTEEYLKLKFKIKSFDDRSLQIPFKGRSIDPDQFIIELLELDKGDFDDADDQVTRMAGLVLAESVKIQSPHEKISDFDFTIDIKNYDFRPEQLEAIAKLHFKINSEILHVKVMIDEKLSFKKYLELKNKIPPNEQGTIITFQALSAQINEDMKNDATIQIIDEEGVRIWVSITPQIPARVNSISKITFDPLSKLENKIVKVSSVFYETGFAIVNVFPEMNEETVLARTLEEIPLFVGGANNFNEYADEYSDFLTVLFTTSNYDDVIDGIFKNKFDHVMKNLFFKFEFDYNVVELNFAHSNKRDIFNCNCIKYAENNLKFCSHLISALDYVFRHTSKQNRLRKVLEIWVTENISVILDRLEITKENYNDGEISDFIEGKFKILTDL